MCANHNKIEEKEDLKDEMVDLHMRLTQGWRVKERTS